METAGSPHRSVVTASPHNLAFHGCSWPGRLLHTAIFSCQTQAYLAQLFATPPVGQKIWLIQPMDGAPGVPSLGDEVLPGSNDAKMVSMRSMLSKAPCKSLQATAECLCLHRLTIPSFARDCSTLMSNASTCEVVCPCRRLALWPSAA